MKRCVIAVVAVVFLSASPAFAADKTHQQMMAEIRMLQEQQTQILQAVATLADTLKVMTTKIDDGTGAARKGFADQKVLVDGVAENVRVLREKADDTNVRLSTMSQELESLRQTISSMSVGAPAAPTGVTGDPTQGPPPTTPQTTPASGVSPQKAWDAAFNDYTGGQYDLAIAGFEFYLKNFPTSPRAGEAQLNIGNSYYAMGNYQQAVSAFQKVTTDFAQSPAAPTAWYKLGLSYESLKQIDLARKAYETLMKTYPTAIMDTTLAKQRLDALNKKQP
jgi:tol-pal system protein YbgF